MTGARLTGGNYVYKMQWLFEPKTAYKVIRSIGARSLTCVTLRDLDLKIVDTYTSMVGFPYEVADDETIKYIQRQIKKDPTIRFVELYRTNR
jgi:hypothetical protein